MIKHIRGRKLLITAKRNSNKWKQPLPAYRAPKLPPVPAAVTQALDIAQGMAELEAEGPVKPKIKRKKEVKPFLPGDVVRIDITATDLWFVTAEELKSHPDGFVVLGSFSMPTDEGRIHMVDLQGVENDVPHTYLTLIRRNGKEDPPVTAAAPPCSVQTLDVRQRRRLKI